MKKLTEQDLISKLMSDGRVVKDKDGELNPKIRQRDQAEIGRLRRKNKTLENNYAMLMESYIELANFVKEAGQ